MLDAQNAPLSGRKVYEMQLDSGELVWLTPPSVFLTAAIRQKLDATYPEIDQSAYEVTLEDSMIPGDKVLTPEGTAAYNAAVLARENKIKAALADAFCAIALDLPSGRAEALARYAPALQTARVYADLPADDWEAVVNHFIISNMNDKRKVIAIAGMNRPLEEAEVQNGLLIFRSRVSGDGGQPPTADGTPVEPEAPGANGVERVALQPVG